MARVYAAAVVGAGMGGKASMAALSASPRFQLVAVADMQPGRARSRPGTVSRHPHIRRS